MNRNFTEGSDVQAGQSLYQIIPRPIRQVMTVRKANWRKVNRRRHRAFDGKTLRSARGYENISQQEYDQAIADARQADAA